MDGETEVVDVRLPNGVLLAVEVIKERGAGDVSALDRLNFDQVQGVLDGLAQVVSGALAKARPNRASAELGLKLKVESGQLTGVLVQAGDSASLKISLTWERTISAETPPDEGADEEMIGEPASAPQPDDGRRAE